MKRPLLIASILFACACGGADSNESAASSDDELTSDVTQKDSAGGRFAGKFASPTIARVADVDHAYFAKQTIAVNGNNKTFHVPHATFANGGWSAPHEALPHLGKGADEQGPVWAPAIGEIGPNHWMLYYTAQIAPTHDNPHPQKKCIWRAHAAGPQGPFVDDFDGPIVCQGDTLWTIDPYLVHDAQGDWHLAARVDLGNGINSIQIRRLTANAEHFEPGSDWHLLVRNEQGSWDQHVMENAGIVHLAPPNGRPGHWFVFYSALHWDDDTYSIGYADCGENINGVPGGCKKVTAHDAFMATDAKKDLFGPGTPTFYRDQNKNDLMSIQAWHFKGGVAPGSPNLAANRKEGQIMRTYEISIDNDYHPHVALKRVDL